MVETTDNPLGGFEPIEVEGYGEEVKKAQIPPLTKGKYKVEIIDNVPSKSKAGNPMVKFKCKVVDDSNEENNGKKVQTRPLVLKGPGLTFFLDFVKIVTPSRAWPSGKKFHITKEYLDSFNGCAFLADIEPDVKRDSSGKAELVDGEVVLSGFNAMTAMYSIR